MVSTNGAVASVAATKKNGLFRVLMANLIVFVMVGSAFFVAVAAAAAIQPKVWTNAQEYFPGEPVVILGEGFLAGPVTITLSHWSSSVQDVNYRDIAIVGSDGTFRYDKYNAQSVDNAATPVSILAYQDAQHQATGSFIDPAATEKIEGYTLAGSNTWTTGDTKGYNEGDSIPMRVYVPNIYGIQTVTVRIAVDFIDTTKGYRVFGFDYLSRVLYTPDPPVPPYNNYANLTGTLGWTPFSVDPAQGSILGASRVANEYESPNQLLLVWDFTLQFASTSVDYAYVHFGAHLTVSNTGATPPLYGASFYPGSSLHGRFISVNGVDIGNKELPVPTKQILTPPNMHISKSCNPEVVPLGGIVTFTIDMWNTGEADALSVVLLDTLPMVVTYMPGTAQYWTTSTGSWQPFRNPDSSDTLLNTITWNIGTIRGTGKTNEGLPALPVFHFKVSFSVQVKSDALPKTYTNFASITHTDSAGNPYGPIVANCSFDVVVVTFEKFADRECAAVGETITYWFIIRNPSMVTLTYKLWDPLFKPYDPNSPLWTGTLPPKSVVIIDSTIIPALAHTVTVGDEDHLVNTAWVTVTDGHDVEITLYSSWEVDILHPAIVIEKEANLQCAAEGDTVTYTITVSNPTTDTEMWFTVHDPLLAPVYGDPLWTGYLAPGDSDSKTFDYVVPDIPVNPNDPFAWELVNTATVDAHDYQYVAGQPWSHLHLVHAEASVAVDIYHPAIEIQKWADKGCAAVGETVTYFIQVHNPTLDTPMDFQISDPILGGIIWGPGSVDMYGYPYWALAPGETVLFGGDVSLDAVPDNGYVYLHSLEYTVTGNEPTDPYTNMATVVAWDPQDHYVSATSNGWTVDVRHIDVQVTKWGDKTCAAVGEDVIYEITVHNPTDTVLDFTLSDSQLGYLWGPGSFDMWGFAYWPLAPGETIIFGGNINSDVVEGDGYVYLAALDHTISANDNDPLVNIATVTVWDSQYGTAGEWAYLHIASVDSNSWTVDVRHIDVQVAKWADKRCAAVGEDVNYFIDVYNPTDTTLDFTITDSQLGLIWGAGSVDMYGTPYWPLAPGEFIEFGGDASLDFVPDNGYVYVPALKHTVNANDADPLTNTASVTVWDNQYNVGDEWAYLHIKTVVSNEWTVDIRHVGISIEKQADKSCAAVGEVVIYSITVTNTGDTPEDFILTDNLLGTIWGYGTGITGDNWNDPYWTLAPGESVTFGGDSFADVVYQDGYVYIAKMAYTITGLEDLNGNEVPDDPLVNTASVFAWDDQYLQGDQWAALHSASGSSSWTVDVRHPGIYLDKWADKTCAAPGESVTYWFYIENTGDTPLTYDLYDDLFGGLIWSGTLDVGGDITLVGSYPVTGTEDLNGDGLADDPLINTAWVNAWDDQYSTAGAFADLHFVTSMDQWSIDVRHVGISIVKQADKSCAAVGEIVTYSITVMNTGDTPLDFIVTDDLLGTIWGYGTGITGDNWNDPYWTLAPGESVTFGGDSSADVVYQDGYVYIAKMAYTVTGDEFGGEDPYTNTASVFAWDDQYAPGDQWASLHSDSGSSSWTVDVRYVGISVNKWADKTCAAVGETVTYSITVQNTGDTPEDFILTDDLLGTIWGYGTGITGDMWGDPYWTLAPGEMVTFGGDPSGDAVWQDGYVYIAKMAYTVTGDEFGGADPYTNTANVFAWDNQYVAGGLWADLHSASGSSSWTVDVRHPGIFLDKWADKTCAAVGEDVAYFFYIENTGDTTLTFQLYDDLYGGLGYTGTLVPGEWILLTYTHTVTGTEDVNGDGHADDPLINTAWVNAWDDQYKVDDQWASLHFVTATDQFSIDVRHPGMQITKSADKRCAEVGEVVTYSITVTNTGDATLDFILTDDLLGTIWGYGTGITGDNWGDPYWALAPGESVTFGGDSYADVVWQDGYVYIAKMAYTVTGDEFGGADPYTNTASVFAWDDQYELGDQWADLHSVSGSSSWTVDILHPMISIVKVAYPTEVMVGDWIIYEITVTNPSSDTWMDFTLTDSMFGLLWGSGTGITGDNWGDPYWTLAPGESVTFGGNSGADVVWQDGYVYLSKLHYQAQDTDFPEIDNTATVEAWDYQLHYRYASDDATVTVLFFAHLTGYVYQDNDLNDNLIGPGDVGLFNWRVTLTGTDVFGNPVNRFVFSDGTGFYDFGDVVPGSYTVAEVLVEHPGWVNTGPVSYAFNIAGGENKRFDFGNIQYGRITGVKFLDDHMNGYQDLAPWPEVGLEGWIIHADGVLVNGDVVHLTTITGPDGTYAFDNLLPGVYEVWEEVPPGEDPANWVAPVTGSIYHDVEIQSGWEVTCCKFGNVRLETIWGWKFLDWNMNRVKDGEPGIEGWHITLTGWLNDGLFPFSSIGATPVGPITITTDANGVWSFSGLLPGVYVITEESPDGWYHTTPMSITFWIASYHGVSQVKFGNVPLTAITGQKFFDKDMDGVMDAGEPGLGGWTITLEKETAPGVWTLWGSTTTDPTGAYEFKWLLPGTYRVNEVLQGGWYATSTLPMEVIIPAYTISHQTLPGTVVANIGNVMYGSICGYKFEDLVGPNGEYPNGLKDANEYGVGNWEIKLDGRQVNKVHVSMTIYTNNIGPLSDIGKYLFANLLPGVYWVNETELINWVPTTTSVSKLTLSAYPFWPVNLVQNFGNMHPADPQMNFVLKRGVNLWSSPLLLTTPMHASDLARIIGPSCAKISKLDSATGQYTAFIPQVSTVGGPLDFEIVYGIGYYVSAKSFTTFKLEGDIVSGGSAQVSRGVNIVGFNMLRPVTASEFVSMVQGARVYKVSYLGTDGLYHAYIPGVTTPGSSWDFAMSQGNAYFLTVSGNASIVYPAST